MARKPKHGPDSCEGCGLRYTAFTTGMTFAEVRQQFWRADPDPKTWVNKRRATVLGRWHEIKTGMWLEHVSGCETFAKAA